MKYLFSILLLVALSAPAQDMLTRARWWQTTGIPAGACVGAYQAKGAASQAASYVNLAAPLAYALTGTSAPTWTSSGGWVFNGSSQYLDTGLVPASGWTMIIRFSGASPGDSPIRCIFGCHATGARFYLAAYNSNLDQVMYGSGERGIVGPGLAAGTLCISGNQGYRNGVADGAKIAAWTGTATNSITIGKLNGYAQWWIGNVYAVAFYNTVLSAQQVAAVHAQMMRL